MAFFFATLRLRFGAGAWVTCSTASMGLPQFVIILSDIQRRKRFSESALISPVQEFDVLFLVGGVGGLDHQSDGYDRILPGVGIQEVRAEAKERIIHSDPARIFQSVHQPFG